MNLSDPSHSSASGILVSKSPIDFSGDVEFIDAQVRAEAINAAIEATNRQFPVLNSPLHSHGRVFNKNRFSIRSYVPEDEGHGYWDLFRLSENLIVQVADCQYYEPKWLGAGNEGYLKIRLLRSGRLNTHEGKLLLGGPGGMLAYYPANSDDGYFISEKSHCRLVVLCCTTCLLTDELGIDANFTNTLISPKIDHAHKQRIDLTPRLVNCLTDILDSRDMYGPKLRDWFIDGKIKEILSTVIQDLIYEPELSVAANRITRRDQRRIMEAHQIIKSSLHELPTIHALSSMVGINQTKLKAGFKALFGCTIGEYTTQQKMEKAAYMLRTTELPVSAISTAIGYRQQASFSHAFKKYYGCLPKSIRQEI